MKTIYLQIKLCSDEREEREYQETYWESPAVVKIESTGFENTKKIIIQVPRNWEKNKDYFI
jgi:hypothetical protein